MKTKLLTILAIGMIAMTSCSKYPPSSGRLTEDLAVYTKYDVTANFSDYKTFKVVPYVSYINGKDSTTLTDANAMALLNEVSKNMVSRGYTAVTGATKADLGLNVTAIKNTTTTVYSPGWYWGYPGYYPPSWWGYPGYGYGYPYYPTYISSYSTGTVLIDLVDLKKPVGNTVMVRWNAYIRGLLTGSHSQADVLKCVDQAFIQTPALVTTQK